MRLETCCFTGHRLLPEKELPSIQKRLEEQVFSLIQQGVKYFGTGGALGFDTLAAQTVLKVRQTYSEIKLILVLPCRDQSKHWSQNHQTVYQGILAQADKIVYTSEIYYKGCMQKRNRHLVDSSAYCICYLTQATGGTAYTVRYAKAQGLTILSCADKHVPPSET